MTDNLGNEPIRVLVISGAKSTGFETKQIIAGFQSLAAEIAERIPGAKIEVIVANTPKLKALYLKRKLQFEQRQKAARESLPKHQPVPIELQVDFQDYRSFLKECLAKKNVSLVATRNLGGKGLAGGIGDILIEFEAAGGVVCNDIGAARIARSKWDTYLKLGGKEYIPVWRPGAITRDITPGQVGYIHSRNLAVTARLPAWNPDWTDADIREIFDYYVGAPCFGGKDRRGAFIVKPDNGSQGRGIEKCDLAKDDAEAFAKFKKALKASTEDKPTLIQELVSVSPLDPVSTQVREMRRMERTRRGLTADVRLVDRDLAAELTVFSRIAMSTLADLAEKIKKGGQDIRVFVASDKETGEMRVVSRTLRIADNSKEVRSNLSLGGKALRLVGDEEDASLFASDPNVPPVILPQRIVDMIDAAALGITEKIDLDYAGVDIALINTNKPGEALAANIGIDGNGKIRVQIKDEADVRIHCFEVNAFPGFKGAKKVWNINYGKIIAATCLGKLARERGTTVDGLFQASSTAPQPAG